MTVRGIDPAILSRAVVLLTLADRDVGLDEAMCAELQSIAAAHQGIPVMLGLAELVLVLCDAVGDLTDMDPVVLRQGLALFAAEHQS